jgi:hypothetical protein
MHILYSVGFCFCFCSFVRLFFLFLFIGNKKKEGSLSSLLAVVPALQRESASWDACQNGCSRALQRRRGWDKKKGQNEESLQWLSERSIELVRACSRQIHQLILIHHDLCKEFQMLSSVQLEQQQRIQRYAKLLRILARLIIYLQPQAAHEANY